VRGADNDIFPGDGVRCPRLEVLHMPAWQPGPGTAGTVSGTFVREHVHSAVLHDDVGIPDFVAGSALWRSLVTQGTEAADVVSPKRTPATIGSTRACVSRGDTPGSLLLTWLATRRCERRRAPPMRALPNGR